jgi:hypothetical protein
MAPQKESALYPRVERWLKDERCFKTATNTGTKAFRPDLIGVRDVGGPLAGDVEILSVEVKNDNGPFVRSCGQALSYRLCSNLVYLADTGSFQPEEVDIARALGVGLLEINGKDCRERLSSPHYSPATQFSLPLLEKINLARCQLCGSTFEFSDSGDQRLIRLNGDRYLDDTLRNAKGEEGSRGLRFWNWEVADRKKRMGLMDPKDDTTYERRHICRDCVGNILYGLMPSIEDEKEA